MTARPFAPARLSRFALALLLLTVATSLAGAPEPAQGGGPSAQAAAVGSADAAGESGGSLLHVPEPKRRPLIRLAAAGDVGTGKQPEYDTVEAMTDVSKKRRFAKVLLLGDLVYENGDPRLVRDRVLKPFRPLIRRGAELVPALGNHDYIMKRPDAIMRRLGRHRRYYVERSGAVRIVVLDSNRVTERQTRWLRRTLRRQPRGLRWTIAIMHHPPYSAGAHGSDMRVRRAWSPLFARFDVPLVLAGHDHDYQRSRRIRGVTYVVSGGAAKTRPTGTEPFTVISRSVLHFTDLIVFRHRIVGRAIDHKGKLVDRFVVRRR